LFGSSIYYFERVQLLLGEDKEHTISPKRQPQSSRIRRVVARPIQDDDAMHIGTGEAKAKLQACESTSRAATKEQIPHTTPTARDADGARETKRMDEYHPLACDS
jgi:hypothetical protein